jgi:hypothetical protein
MTMAVRESGTWSGGEVTPGLSSSLKGRTCDSGDDAKQEAIASFVCPCWLGLPRGRGIQINVTSSAVYSVTRKPKRSEREGEAEGKTKSNRQTAAIEKVDCRSEKKTRKYLINGQGGGFTKLIAYTNQYRDN